MSDWTGLFDARLETAGVVAEEQLARIPAKRGVVLLVGDDDEPIVMITAADMRSRTRSRLAEPLEAEEAATKRTKRPDLRQITRAIFYARCESHFETDWRFLELSRQVWPSRYVKMLSWKAPWFIHLNLYDAYPHFARTREVFAREGQYFGPFASGRDANGFIDALADVFDLCRSVTCLRRAPNGPRCAYAEMNRCVSPADGTISMDEYRDVLALAADFVADIKNRQALRQSLSDQMAAAAKDLKFEQAAGIRNRLARLDVFEGESYRYVAPAERFAFILAQPGAGVHEFRVFLAHRGYISFAGALEYPLAADAPVGVLRAMRKLTATDSPVDGLGRLRMGLVARTLFGGSSRRGLVMPWREDLTAETLAEWIRAGRDELGLRESPASCLTGRQAKSDKTQPASPGGDEYNSACDKKPTETDRRKSGQ
jgi:SAM-dependent methyltransferase